MPNKDYEIINLEDEKIDSLPDEVVGDAEDLPEPSLDDDVTQKEEQNLTLKQKIKHFFKDLWQNPKKRWSLIGGIFVLLIIGIATPHSRYFLLNKPKHRQK